MSVIELDNLLAVVTPEQLTGAVTGHSTARNLDSMLDKLSAGQTGDLLAPMAGDTLSSTLAR